MNHIERKEAEIEIDYCIHSLRSIVHATDSEPMIGDILRQLGKLTREAGNKMAELRGFSARERATR